MAKASIKPHGEGARPHAPQAGRAVAPRPPQLVRLGEVAPMFVDGDWIESKDQSDRGIRLVQTGNIGVGQYLDKIERAKYISEDTFLRLKCTEIFAGDVLVSRLPDPVGRACVLPDLGQRAITAVDCSILRFDPIRCAARYFVHFTLSKEYASQLSRFLAGSTRIRISRKNLQSIQIPLPPLPEQKRIAAILDKICEMKRNAEARLQKLDLLVKARFVELFGDGKSPAQRLGDIAEITGGLTKNGKRKSLPLKYKYLRVANVFFNRLDLSDVQEIGVEEAEVSKALLKKDDLLFVEGNGSIEQVGRVALWSGEIDPCLHQNHLIKARFSAGIIPQYALFFFMNEVGRQQIKECAVSTTGLHTLSTGKVANLRIPLPPLALQRQFAAFVEKVEGLKATAKKELEQVDLLYRAKLQEFFG